MHQDIIYQLALSEVKNIGPITARRLIEHFGSAENVLRSTPQQLMVIPGMGPKTAQAIGQVENFTQLESELKWAKNANVSCVCILDKNYPKQLIQCPDAPLVLYFYGSSWPANQKSISVIGTRKATPRGKEICRELISELATFDPIIVSGLAYGVDIESHKSALNHELKTYAILAHGLDRLYPSQHASIAKQMVQNGGLISEFKPGTNPDKENFPRRNRIIAGLTEATVVVESASKGGSLITAKLAGSYYRDVFAFPGRSSDRSSNGCNHLIRTHQATLVESASDIIKILGWGKKNATKNKPNKLELDPDESQIMEALNIQNYSMSLDEISVQSKLPVHQVSTLLLHLEFKGLVRALPGKHFEAIL